MPCFRLTNKAKEDLKEIARYTESRWGRGQRNIYLTMLDDCFHQLAANPLIGEDCSHIFENYRKLNAGSHLIFYRQSSEKVTEIVRILHGRMDIETQLSET